MQDSIRSIIRMGRRWGWGWDHWQLRQVYHVDWHHQRPMPGVQKRKTRHDADMDESTLSTFGPKWLWWRSRRLRFFDSRSHFVGDKAVIWISLFFTDGVFAKCSFLSFKCRMVIYDRCKNICISVKLHPLCIFSDHCRLQTVLIVWKHWNATWVTSATPQAPGCNSEGSLCEHRQCESFGRCAKYMDCSSQGEVGKLGFEFTDQRCYWSV